VDPNLTDDQQFFAETCQRFLTAHGGVAALRRVADVPAGFDSETWRGGAELGWTSLLFSEDEGGGSLSGQGICDVTIVAELLGGVAAATPLTAVTTFAAATTGALPPRLASEILPVVLSGESVATWAFSEPDRPWHGNHPATTLSRAGDGYRLDGAKSPVEYGEQADWYVVTCDLDGELAQIVVARGADGVTTTPLECVDLAKRHAEVRFDGVAVPADGLLRVGGTTKDAVAAQLRVANLLQCAESCGGAQRVFDLTLQYAFERHSFGRPLASYQALKHRFADLKTALECAMATTTAAVEAHADGDATADERASIAKAFVGAAIPELMQDCVQLHGGIGVTWEHDLHLFLRRAVLNREIYGSPIEHRERIASLVGL
jgi:alkylation response protein AidB-like acyl-CoA dehydrogenase